VEIEADSVIVPAWAWVAIVALHAIGIQRIAVSNSAPRGSVAPLGRKTEVAAGD
jgi:hypothetical protein